MAIRQAEAVFVSAASEWELTIKAALGKIELRRSMLEAAIDAGFEPLAVSFQHARTVGSLKPLHKDPFDRLLVAVAKVEGLSLVTSDVFLADYSIVVIDAAR
jgi:PIN domain nuclease of toxin-antitoxin system